MSAKKMNYGSGDSLSKKKKSRTSQPIQLQPALRADFRVWLSRWAKEMKETDHKLKLFAYPLLALLAGFSATQETSQFFSILENGTFSTKQFFHALLLWAFVVMVTSFFFLIIKQKRFFLWMALSAMAIVCLCMISMFFVASLAWGFGFLAFLVVLYLFYSNREKRFSRLSINHLLKK
ncbi:hypothetical protein [Pelagicoccus sp. SDUM812003]|uniref:hypothetical protein n=1 Tax=Pelagicoccus sp. SDUM812003 TaxID=3041267 RepID=UPI00280CCFD5|nr:hypothetical protein [Pelagicoccus sp. SDUM812003]MDQ8205753.1 hypothetical protein [Pelagicoccus sp. SDUM812003]